MAPPVLSVVPDFAGYQRSAGRRQAYYTYRGVNLLIDCRYPVYRYAQILADMIDACPLVITGRLQRITVQNQHRVNRNWSAQKRDSFASASCYTREMNFYFNRAFGGPVLTQVLFDHEMAHLVGYYHGPPNPPAWRKARIADGSLARKRTMCSVRGALEKGVCIEGRQVVFPRSEWITDYAEVASSKGGQVEDWADAYCYFLYDRRLGALHEVLAGSVSFAECYPHRAALLEAYFDVLPEVLIGWHAPPSRERIASVRQQ